MSAAGRGGLLSLVAVTLISLRISIAEDADSEAKQEISCPDCHGCSGLEPDVSAAVTCLQVCGFAIVRGAYDVSTLEALHTDFVSWRDQSGNASLYQVDGHRGSHRAEYVLPWTPFHSDVLHFNPLVTSTVQQFVATVVKEQSNILRQWLQDNPRGAVPPVELIKRVGEVFHHADDPKSDGDSYTNRRGGNTRRWRW